MTIHKKKVMGLILNGGLSRRMGSDKSLKKIFDKSLIDITIEKVKLQVDILVINSNKEKINKNLEVIPDCITGNLGPLVGILSGLKWLKKNQNFFSCCWLAVFPVDSPFFPENLIKCFFENIKDEKIIMAKCEERVHPVFSMWHLDNLLSLEEFIIKGGRKIDFFSKKKKTRVVNFPFIGYDPFFNINNLDDLAEAKKILNKIGGIT